MKSAVWAVLAVAGVFYASTMIRGTGYEAPHNRYNRLAAALAAGRLDIPIDPIPQLKTTPYDFSTYSSEITRQKLDDLSVYNGKIYSYFSVVPALVLYLPFRIATAKADLPEEFAVFLFGMGVLLFAALLWTRLQEAYFAEAPAWMGWTVLFVLGLCNLVPFLVPNASVYIVAILSGLFFLTGAIYFLAPAPAVSPRRFMAAGLFLGLAAASRPNLIPVVLLLAVITAFMMRREPLAVLRERLGALVFPMLLCGAGVALYNFARFGNIFEFGGRYQILAPNTQLSAIYFDPSRVFYNFYLYLFQAPRLDGEFPFVHGDYLQLPFLRWPKGCYIHGGVSIGRVFFGIPFNGLLFLCPLVYLAAREGLWTACFKKGLLRAVAVTTAVYFFGLQMALRAVEGWPRLTEARLFLTRLSEEVPLHLVLGAIFYGLVVVRVRDLLAAETPPVKPDFPRLPFFLLAISSGVTLFVYASYCQAAERYSAEFTTLVLLITAIVWFYFDGKLRDEPFARQALRATGLVLAAISVLFGAAYSFIRAS